MKPEISLSQSAVQIINDALTAGKNVELAVRNGRLIIWETSSRKKYEVVVAQR